MKHLVIFLSGLLLASCAQPYRTVKAPASNSLNLIPRQRKTEVFYPGYLMPKEAYYEMGIFEYKLHVSQGPPENKLPLELHRRNLDGAIVLDRRRTWSVNNNEYETLTCMGILMEENVKDLTWLERVDVELYQDEILLDTAAFYFSGNGQFSKFAGNDHLRNVAQSIQPWYFLQQANSRWSERPSGHKWPHRRLKLGSTWPIWKNVSSDDSLIYRLSYGDFRSSKIYLEEIGKQLVPIQVIEDGTMGEIESIFLIDRLKKQVWHRKGHNQRIVYRYFYTDMQEQNIFRLVQPQDLEQ